MRAIQQREFVVHYQPIMAFKSRRCVGCEALVRWRRPDGSLVSPDQFIPLAEETGLIMPITDQVIAAVVSDLGAYLVAERSMHVAINVCAADIKTGRILPVITAAPQNLTSARMMVFHFPTGASACSKRSPVTLPIAASGLTSSA